MTMHPQDDCSAGTLGILRAVWPVMASLFLCGNLYVIVFPFFTYVRSSGTFQGSLPTVSCRQAVCAELASAGTRLQVRLPHSCWAQSDSS